MDSPSSGGRGVVGRRWLLRFLVGAAAVCLLGYALRHVDPGRVAALLGGTPSLWLAALPYLVAQSLDAAALARLLRQAGVRAAFGDMLRVRLAADAVAFSFPSGQVVAEATALHMLREQGPLSARVAALAGRRIALGLAHGTMLMLATVLGMGALRRSSAALFGRDGLEWAVAATGFVLLAGFGLAAALLRGGRAAQVFATLASRIPVRRLRAWLGRRRGAVRDVDQDMARCLGPAAPRGLVLVGLFVAALFVESFETWFILARLGSGLTFLEVVSFESLLSLGRALAFVTPAGLGVQDLGYVAFLSALDAPDASNLAAAFLIAKRGKEILWIAGGWLLLSLGPLRPPRGLDPLSAAAS